MTDSCLFLGDWEARRAQCHAERRQRAEQELCGLQLRVRSGAASLDAWLAILESRRKLEEVAAGAAARAVDELEARWKPQRLDVSGDSEVASWLLVAEREHIAARTASAARWAAALPSGGPELRLRYQQLIANLAPAANGGPGGRAAAPNAVAYLYIWDEAHEAAAKAWQSHSGRLQAASQALKEGHAPPDIWLSEVQYRERARGHLAQQAAAERALNDATIGVASAESDRSDFWAAYSAAYARAAVGPVAGGSPTDVSGTSGASSAAPAVKINVISAESSAELAPLPDMPSASGAVLQKTKVSIPTEKGIFGFGKGGWSDGCTLVLTLHGYLHVFAPAGSGESAEEELVESAIKASVYVPMATRCIFRRKGQERDLELAEADAEVAAAPPGGDAGNASAPEGQHRQPQQAAGQGSAAPQPTPAGRLGGGLRKLFGMESGTKVVPRCVRARVADDEAFTALERRCHEFRCRGLTARPAGEVTAAGAGK